MVRIFHRFFFYNRHSAFVAVVSTGAFGLLMLQNLDALDFRAAIDTGHQDVRAGGLMLVNVFTYALCLALSIRLAFYGCVVT